jgi:hypothetical protein
MKISDLPTVKNPKKPWYNMFIKTEHPTALAKVLVHISNIILYTSDSTIAGNPHLPWPNPDIISRPIAIALHKVNMALLKYENN